MTDWYRYDDGGRSAAGYAYTDHACVARAIAIATQLPYQRVIADLNRWAKLERRRRFTARSNPHFMVYKPTYRRYLTEELGWTWTPTMHVGSGCVVHLRADELPSGRLIVSVSKHVVAVIDGRVHDIFDCSRDGRRCVYGYFREEGS